MRGGAGEGGWFSEITARLISDIQETCRNKFQKITFILRGAEGGRRMTFILTDRLFGCNWGVDSLIYGSCASTASRASGFWHYLRRGAAFSPLSFHSGLRKTLVCPFGPSRAIILWPGSCITTTLYCFTYSYFICNSVCECSSHIYTTCVFWCALPCKCGW